MHVGFDDAALVPGGQQDSTASTAVLDILERVHHIRDAAKAGDQAGNSSPDTVTRVWSVRSQMGRYKRLTVWCCPNGRTRWSCIVAHRLDSPREHWTCEGLEWRPPDGIGTSVDWSAAAAVGPEEGQGIVSLHVHDCQATASR